MSRPACALLALLVLSACPRAAANAAGPDEVMLRQMNDDYVRAFLTCDVNRFRSLLADDFTGVLASGGVIDKAEFLREAKEHPDAQDLRLHDVVIRTYGDTGLIGALVTYRRSDGTLVRTRYSTLYLRRGGAWSMVWVQWTRVTGP